jgi:hypothetical protein
LMSLAESPFVFFNVSHWFFVISECGKYLQLLFNQAEPGCKDILTKVQL